MDIIFNKMFGQKYSKYSTHITEVARTSEKHLILRAFQQQVERLKSVNIYLNLKVPIQQNSQWEFADELFECV